MAARKTKWQKLAVEAMREMQAMEDPAVRGAAATKALDELQTLFVTLSRARVAAVAELRAAGFSHQAVADALGVTRGRAAQISREATDSVVS